MALRNIKLDSISEDDLQAMIDNKVIESKTIEYKEILPGYSDAERKEFLADVTSFANASGGDIVFGIETKEGEPAAMPGLKNVNSDKEIQRLESMIRDGISPRIIGHQIRSITLQNGGAVIIVRTPRSWTMPHMVAFKKDYRFYTRNSNGKHPMDAAEIRSAVLLSETTAGRIRDFRAGRIAQIRAAETPVSLLENSKIVLHLIPLGAFDDRGNIDMVVCESCQSEIFPLFCPQQRNNRYRFNFDGYLSYHGSEEGLSSGYVQVFRNGVIEAVDSHAISKKVIEGAEHLLLYTYDIEKGIIEGASTYLSVQEEIGVDYPVFVLLSLLGIKGSAIYRKNLFIFPPGNDQYIDREDLLMPDIILEQRDENVGRALKPAFDAIWNAAGYRGSAHYDEQSDWVGKKGYGG